MHKNILLLLTLTCAALARADMPAVVVKTPPAPSAQSIADNKEVDAIVADLVSKFNAHAPARDFDPLLARLAKIQVSPYANYRGGGTVEVTDMALIQKVQGARTFITNWQDYLIQKEQGNAQMAGNALSQLIQISAEFTAIPRSTLMELQNSARATSEEDPKLDALTAKVVAAIDAAKVPSDLDAITAAIAGASEPNNFQRQNSRRMQALKFFVQNWQDYLAAVQAGKTLEAQNDLRGLTNTNYDSSFYPRSKILALLGTNAAQPPAPTLKLVAPDSLTLQTLDLFMSELVPLRNAPYFTEHNETGLEPAAQRVRRALDEVQSGNARNALLSWQASPNYGGLGKYEAAFGRMDDEVALKAAPVAIEAPADFQPHTGESVQSYLERATQGAIAAKNWTFALRVLTLRRDLNQRGGGNWEENISDVAGFTAFIRGMYHEEAQQWKEAVANYTAALSTTGPHLPVKEIGARLQKIRAAHPAEYEEGTKTPDYPTLIQGLMQQRIMQQQMSHYPNNPAAQGQVRPSGSATPQN